MAKSSNPGRRNAGGLSRLKQEYAYQRAGGSGRVEALKKAYGSVKRNPKSLTLRNMAVVTVKRLPGGAVAVTGRRMNARANPKRKPAKRR